MTRMASEMREFYLNLHSPRLTEDLDLRPAMI